MGAISVFLFLLTFLRLPIRTRYEHSSGDLVFSDWKPFWSIGAEDSIRFDILLLLWVGLLVVTVFLYLLLQGQSDSRHKALRAENHPLQATSAQTPKDLSAKLFWWGFIGLPTSVFVYTCISDPGGLEFSTGFVLGLFAGTALPLAISGAILGLLIWLCVRRSIGKRTCVAGTTIAISAMLILGMYYRNPSPWAVTFILVSCNS